MGECSSIATVRFSLTMNILGIIIIISQHGRRSLRAWGCLGSYARGGLDAASSTCRVST